MGDAYVSPTRGNRVLGEEVPSAQSQPPNSHTSEIPAENWRLAELLTEKMILGIQPTGVADQKRRDVVEHVRNLIKQVTDAEVIHPWFLFQFSHAHSFVFRFS